MSKKAVLKTFGIFTGKFFSCEYCAIFKNTYFEEHLQTDASENLVTIIGFFDHGHFTRTFYYVSKTTVLWNTFEKLPTLATSNLLNDIQSWIDTNAAHVLEVHLKVCKI